MKSCVLAIAFICASLFTLPAKARDTLKVAAIAYPISYNQTADSFLEKIEKYVSEASDSGAALAVFPELLTFDMVRLGGASTKDQMRNIARDFSPRYRAALVSLSQKHQIAILGGSTPWIVSETPEKIVNRALMSFPDGTLIEQDKAYLTPEESGLYGWSGTALTPVVHNTPFGKLVILTCYDVEMPVLSHRIAALQPELILIPSMSDAAGFSRVRVTAQARAVEHHAYVVLASAVDATGSERDHFSGNAAIFETFDKGYKGIVAQGGVDVAGAVLGTLNLKKLRKTKIETDYYPGRDQGNAPVSRDP